MTNKILLSFDVEEFDIPNEYGGSLAMSEQLIMGKQGAEFMLEVLNTLQVTTTCFTTAFFAEQFPELIQTIANNNEIASHSYYHTGFNINDVARSKHVLESISGQEVVGYRSPRLQEIDLNLLLDAGYIYDSSLNPTYIPGRYNKRSEPRTIHKKNNLFIIPSSVTPRFRIPMFWLSFKVFPLSFLKHWSQLILKHDGYLVLYFHPWEFCNLKLYPLPFYIKQLDGERMKTKFIKYITWLKTQGEFIQYKTKLMDA